MGAEVLPANIPESIVENIALPAMGNTGRAGGNRTADPRATVGPARLTVLEDLDGIARQASLILPNPRAQE